MIKVTKVRIGSVLSFKNGHLNLHCKDEELENKLKTIMEIVASKLGEDWTSEDYNVFFRRIASFEIKTLNECYDIFVSVLSLPKEQLEQRLRDLDTKLKLNVFNEDRIVKRIDGQTKIVYVPHKFTMADLIVLFEQLSSEMKQHSAFMRNAYDKTINQCETVKEKEETTKMFYDLIENDDPILWDVFYEKYYAWIGSLSKDDMVYQYLENQRFYLKQMAEASLLLELLKLEDSHEFKRYVNQRALECLNNSAKTGKKLDGYKRSYCNR